MEMVLSTLKMLSYGNAVKSEEIRMVRRRVIFQFTPLAVARLGVYDDFYDLFSEFNALYETITIEVKEELRKNYIRDFKAYFKSHEDVVDRSAKPYAMRLVLPYFKKYLSFFTSENLDVTYDTAYEISFNYLRFQYDFNKRKNFTDFLRDFQIWISKYIYCKQHSNSDRLYSWAYDSQINIINDYVKQYVEEHSLLEIYDAGDELLESDYHTLYVYDNLSSVGCRVNHHALDAKCIVCGLTSSNQYVKLPVHYCSDCDKVFIGRTTLKLFEKEYGKLTMKRKNLDGNTGLSSLSPESVLYQYGYNVSDGRTDKERQDLLLTLLEKGLVKYDVMVACLEFNIKVHTNHPEAVGKWIRDLKFIGNHVIE